MKRRRGITIALIGMAFLAALATAAGVLAYPVLAAPLCPTCFGLETIAPGLVVEAGMSAVQRARLKADIETARTTVQAFYGTSAGHPILVACATEACDQRLGGRGARATTLGTPLATVIRLSPRGLDATILAHEFSHVELHRRVGLRRQITGAVPAWFDEGIAVLVSDDNRYLKPGHSAAERCLDPIDGPLPQSPFEWGSAAGRDPRLYAAAACRVLTWMAAHGGAEGVLRALDDIAAGRAFQP